MDQTSALDLGIPPQRKPDRNSFDYRPKAVDAWLKDLPIANLGETSRAVYEALREVNQLRVRPAARLQFLEKLGERLGYTITGLRKHYPAREFPMPPKNRKIAELAMTLLREITTGYHILIQGASNGEFKLKRDDLALAIQRALLYSGRLLVENYGLYEPSPSGLWKTAHTLYRIAEGRGIQNLPVKDGEFPELKRTSIADRYKQMLLLSAAGPYRMRHNEATDTYRIVALWASHARLVPAGSPQGQDATYVVDLRSDQPPFTPSSEAAGGDVRAMITSDLVQFAQTQLNGARPWWKFWAAKPPEVDAGLVRRLIMALGPIPKRQFSRQPIVSRAQVLVGLTQITKTLAEEQGAPIKLPEESSQFSGRELRSAEKQGKTEDIWELAYYPGSDAPRASARPAGAALQQVPSRKPAAAAGTEAQQWRLLNISAGGYCLLSDPTQSARAQVGELIALRELNGGHESWQIGAIRWMKHLPTEGLQLGVQVLGPQPVPVVLKPEQTEGGFGAPNRGLMLPEVIATDQPVTLITPALHFAAKRKAKLDGFGSETEVVLTRALETTGTFCQFEFRTAGGAEDGNQFETVFTSL